MSNPNPYLVESCRPIVVATAPQAVRGGANHARSLVAVVGAAPAAPASLVQSEPPLDYPRFINRKKAHRCSEKNMSSGCFLESTLMIFAGVPRGLLLQAVAFKRQSGIHTLTIASGPL